MSAAQAWTVERIRERRGGSMLALVGFEPVGVGEGRCVATMVARPDLLQPMGMLHTGAIVTLADAAATFAALTVTDPEATMEPERFPLAVQVSVNLVRNTREGMLSATAIARHPGRTTQVVETEVRDEQGRLLALATTTHVVVPGR